MLSHFSHGRLFETLWTIRSLPGFSVHRDSPGKNTGLGCHALLQGITLTWEVEELRWPIGCLPIGTRPFRTKTPKRCPFHYRGLECKSRKSRNTWTNRQIWPGNTEWSRAKTNRVLPRKFTGHSKLPLPTTQEKTLHMDITKWSTPKSDWFYSLQPKMEKLYTVNKNKTRSWLWLRSWTPYCQIQT